MPNPRKQKEEEEKMRRRSSWFACSAPWSSRRNRRSRTITVSIWEAEAMSARIAPKPLRRCLPLSAMLAESI